MTHSQLTLTTRTEAELPQVASALLSALRPDDTVALVGPMGSGKTTLVAEMARQAGVEDDAVGSPTFAIVNEYAASGGRTIYHFDLYRLESPAEVDDTGFSDYLDSGALCLIEWPDRAGELLPDDAAEIRIEVDPATGSRTFTLYRP